MRDEWAKVQGRFVDLAITAGADEQLELLARAIESDHRPGESGALADRIATLIRREDAAGLLEACWPLHPVVACLLGPISRRRFGQNQRSIFGFLNSTEPLGFRDFLHAAGSGELYAPDLLWDYLRANLEPSIMASPDGHRWALAVDAIERHQGGGGGDLQLRLLKTIGLTDLFKERSGLVASEPLLACALHEHAAAEIGEALSDLKRSSLVIYRKFSDGYSIFEGSDFDIEQAVEDAYGAIGEPDGARLTILADFRPVIARRHYHDTGALRWHEMAIVPPGDLAEAVDRYTPGQGSSGVFLLVLPMEGDSQRAVERAVRAATGSGGDYDPVIGIPQRTTWAATTLARELLALEHVRDHTPELQGDRVARIEVEGRIGDLKAQIESEFGRALDSARWFRTGHKARPLDPAELNSLASDLADERFADAPRLRNELLNRINPSGSAVAAQNALLHQMALNEGQPHLGIKGFPAERGLFGSLLEAAGLYAETSEGWRFTAPTAGGDPLNLAPAWSAAEELLAANTQRPVTIAEVYDVWRDRPFGIKDGLLPILAASFVLANRSVLAFYREGVFQSHISDLDMEFLARDPRDIQIRWMDLPESGRRLLSTLAEVVRDMDDEHRLTNLEPLDIARGLVAIYDRLPVWTGRTRRLSENARTVRQLFKQARDPNRLLFDDIPRAVSGGKSLDDEKMMRRIADSVREGLVELQRAYPAMLHNLKDTLLADLQAHGESESVLADLRGRAENIRELGGNHRQEAFIVRLAHFCGSDADMEALAGMAVNNPPTSWTDSDIDRAAVELAAMAREFVRMEAYAHVKGRADKRHAMAVVVGTDGRRAPVHDEFDVTDLERREVDVLIGRVDEVLQRSGAQRRNIILAALAEIGVRYLEDRGTEDQGRTAP